MHLLNIKHYVVKSFESKPSFILEMSDGKDYISNGCIFVEMTDKNILQLIADHNCRIYIDELLASPSIDISEITDANYMFNGCTSLTTFSSNMPLVTNASWMFIGCTSLTKFKSDMPKVTDAEFMLSGCISLTKFKSDMPKVTNARYMLNNCTSLVV